MSGKILVYDAEIVKAIPVKDEPELEGIEYCEGWGDKLGMGISVIGAYDLFEDRYRVFTKEAFKEFEELARDRFVVGFNSVSFDDELCAAHGIYVKTNYDLLLEIWDAAGGRYQKGFKLDQIVQANNFGAKTGTGELAPVLWQRGEYGRVFDYCINDVRLTWKLLEQIIKAGWVADPRDDRKLRLSGLAYQDLMLAAHGPRRQGIIR